LGIDPVLDMVVYFPLKLRVFGIKANGFGVGTQAGHNAVYGPFIVSCSESASVKGSDAESLQIN
jgi:hypothetical protein